MLKVVHEIGAAREISKKNESIAERDPKHPYNPAHALKNQEDLQRPMNHKTWCGLESTKASCYLQ